MKQPDNSLIAKYNVAAPRYTSYPTVPFWESDVFDPTVWVSRLKTTYSEAKDAGISLYIHLPFCESLCTYCGCKTSITKNHTDEKSMIFDELNTYELYNVAYD